MSKSCHANTCCSNCSPSQTLNLPWRESIKSIRFFMLFLGTTLFVLALFQKGSIFGLSLFVISYLLIGGEILKNAFISFKNGRMLDENFLMGVATLGAFSIGEYPEAVAVMIFFRVGEFFQDLALKRSRKSIANLMDIRPESATLITINGEKTTHPENITIGSHIIVKPGEKVPLDGVVVQGNSRLNLVALTGESMPRSVKPKDNIFSGSFNLEGALILETTETFANSTVSKILDLVENAATKKAKTEQFITRFAKFYTPFVVGIALLLATLPPLFIENALFSDWLHRSLVFLVVSCPCALVISIPLSFFAGIGAASREGILVKGGNYLEALSHVSRIVFDKTGTLTKGSFSIEKIIPVFEKESKKILELAFLAERYSTHPIAEAILKSQKKALSLKTKNHEELAGLGVKAEYENQILLVGNEALMKRFSVEVEKREGTAVYVALDGKLQGIITLSDTIKPQSKNAIDLLKELGVSDFAMLTGDEKSSALSVAKKLGIEKFYSNLLPHEKVKHLEAIMANGVKKGKTIFVGDGINDAPVLALSDVGVAMGGIGSDAAIEAADIVIMDDNLEKLPLAVKIARKTTVIVWQNIVFALGVKGAILLLASFGIAGMWEAVFGDVGVTLIAVLNATRILHTKI